MTPTLHAVTFLVRNYDKAILFFTEALGFELLEDTPLGDGKRWVRVAPHGGQGSALLLAEATSPDQVAHVGNQTGGRVAFFLHTGDFWADYHHMQERGVRFMEEPRNEPFGVVVVFLDLYGNKWDLIQPAEADGR